MFFVLYLILKKYGEVFAVSKDVQNFYAALIQIILKREEEEQIYIKEEDEEENEALDIYSKLDFSSSNILKLKKKIEKIKRVYKWFKDLKKAKNKLSHLERHHKRGGIKNQISKFLKMVKRMFKTAFKVRNEGFERSYKCL